MRFILAFILSSHLFAEGWQRVCLATFPRSGNHWVRYMVEEATGIVTSSVYIDKDTVPHHLSSSFPWGGFSPPNGYEGVRRYPKEGEIVVIKTHYPVMNSKLDKIPFLRTIRVIRHPIDSIYSWHTYPNKPKGQEIPLDLVIKYSNTWRKFQEFWDCVDGVLTVRYEDLLEDPKAHLRAILSYIGYEVTEEDIERAVEKYPPNGHVLKYLEYFSEEGIDVIQRNLKDLMDQYGYSL